MQVSPIAAMAAVARTRSSAEAQGALTLAVVSSLMTATLVVIAVLSKSL